MALELGIDLREILSGFDFGESSPEEFILFVLVCAGIGLLLLTWLYVLNPKKTSDYNNWINTDYFTKFILSLVVGLFSYLIATSLIIIYNLLMAWISNSPQPVDFSLNFNLAIFSLIVGFILLKIIRTFTNRLNGKFYQEIISFIILSLILAPTLLFIFSFFNLLSQRSWLFIIPLAFLLIIIFQFKGLVKVYQKTLSV